MGTGPANEKEGERLALLASAFDPNDLPPFPVPARADATSHPEEDGVQVVRAALSGKILAVCREEGDRISAGDNLFLLEAMKMENRVDAPADGRVETVYAHPGDTVKVGAALARLVRSGTDGRKEADGSPGKGEGA